jgi:hypothetical protein
MHAGCQNFEVIKGPKGKQEIFHAKTFFYPEGYQNFEVAFMRKPFFLYLEGHLNFQAVFQRIVLESSFR